MKSLCLAVVVVLVCCFGGLTGCGSKSSGPEISESRKPEGHGMSSGGGTLVAGPVIDEEALAGQEEPLDQGASAPFSQDPDSEAHRAVYGRSTAPLYPVFFAFDSSAILDDQLDNLQSSGQHLMANQAMKVMVEGNCDERGTADYNLALGELRALNVKKYLVNLGVATERITTVSYGSQRPLYPGHDEESWAKNRRADLVSH